MYQVKTFEWINLNEVEKDANNWLKATHSRGLKVNHSLTVVVIPEARDRNLSFRYILTLVLEQEGELI
jgi:hypothetical protein